MSHQHGWLDLWDFAKRIAPRLAQEGSDGLRDRGVRPGERLSDIEWAEAQLTVIAENHVTGFAAKDPFGNPLPGEINRLILEEIAKQQQRQQCDRKTVLFEKLPRKVAIALKSGRYEVTADLGAERMTLGPDLLATLRPDLARVCLQGSGGTRYDNIAVRERQALPP